jgi:hypothetical protein
MVRFSIIEGNKIFYKILMLQELQVTIRWEYCNDLWANPTYEAETSRSIVRPALASLQFISRFIAARQSAIVKI